MPTPSDINAGRRRSMIPVLDKEVLDLGVRWVPFGGASAEEIFVLFGWSEARYFQRLHALSQRYVVTDTGLRHRLLRVCDARLTAAAQSVPIHAAASGGPARRPRRDRSIGDGVAVIPAR